MLATRVSTRHAQRFKLIFSVSMLCWSLLRAKVQRQSTNSASIYFSWYIFTSAFWRRSEARNGEFDLIEHCTLILSCGRRLTNIMQFHAMSPYFTDIISQKYNKDAWLDLFTVSVCRILSVFASSIEHRIIDGRSAGSVASNRERIRFMGKDFFTAPHRSNNLRYTT